MNTKVNYEKPILIIFCRLSVLSLWLPVFISTNSFVVLDTGKRIRDERYERAAGQRTRD